jgi:hypothetical protein
MDLAESIVLHITAAVSLGALMMGFLSYRLEQKNRGNALRELVYAKQLDFYLEFNRIGALIEDKCVLFSSDDDKHDFLKEFDELGEELDLFFSKNEILVAENLYTPISDFVKAIHRTSIKLETLNSTQIENELTEISKKFTEVLFEIMDGLSIDELSIENDNVTERLRQRTERIQIK